MGQNSLLHASARTVTNTLSAARWLNTPLKASNASGICLPSSAGLSSCRTLRWSALSRFAASSPISTRVIRTLMGDGVMPVASNRFAQRLCRTIAPELEEATVVGWAKLTVRIYGSRHLRRWKEVAKDKDSKVHPAGKWAFGPLALDTRLLPLDIEVGLASVGICVIILFQR